MLAINSILALFCAAGLEGRVNAFLDANQAVLDEMYDALAAFLGKLDDSVVNWSPLPEDTNSIAAMVTHTIGATTSWLSRAAGAPIQRDRDAEFRVRTSAAELARLVDDGKVQADSYFLLLNDVDPATVRPVRRLSSGTDAEVTVAWCVEHAVIHAGEHWGQIQLTAQLYAHQVQE